MNRLKNQKNKNNKTSANKKSITTWQSFVTKHQQWILIIEVTVILVVGYLLAIAPKVEYITEATQGDVAYWEEQLAIAKTNNARAKKLVELYNSLGTTQRDKLFKILPKDAQIPELMTQLEALFDSENLFLTNFSASEVDFGEGAVLPFRILQLQIVFNKPDDYKAYRRLLSKLEKNMRILNIQSINYTEDAEQFAISAFAYFLK